MVSRSTVNSVAALGTGVDPRSRTRLERVTSVGLGFVCRSFAKLRCCSYPLRSSLIMDTRHPPSSSPILCVPSWLAAWPCALPILGVVRRIVFAFCWARILRLCNSTSPMLCPNCSDPLLDLVAFQSAPPWLLAREFACTLPFPFAHVWAST